MQAKLHNDSPQSVAILDSCRMLQNAADCCRLLQTAADCCRLLQMSLPPASQVSLSSMPLNCLADFGLSGSAQHTCLVSFVVLRCEALLIQLGLSHDVFLHLLIDFQEVILKHSSGELLKGTSCTLDTASPPLGRMTGMVVRCSVLEIGAGRCKTLTEKHAACAQGAGTKLRLAAQ